MRSISLILAVFVVLSLFTIGLLYSIGQLSVRQQQNGNNKRLQPIPRNGSGDDGSDAAKGERYYLQYEFPANTTFTVKTTASLNTDSSINTPESVVNSEQHNYVITQELKYTVKSVDKHERAELELAILKDLVEMDGSAQTQPKYVGKTFPLIRSKFGELKLPENYSRSLDYDGLTEYLDYEEALLGLLDAQSAGDGSFLPRNEVQIHEAWEPSKDRVNRMSGLSHRGIALDKDSITGTGELLGIQNDIAEIRIKITCKGKNTWLDSMTVDASLTLTYYIDLANKRLQSIDSALQYRYQIADGTTASGGGKGTSHTEFVYEEK